ncbi:MAG TPA: hypothetical protein VE575_04350 [Acidimicrobiales bacterium]|jgi:hypothetical protein|nr:hypothetical protein [Acidimicrobiales bacterium]
MAGPKPTVSVTHGGEPTDEEVAAIVAAIEATWPRPVAAAPPSTGPNRWRFSGRWWAKPVPLSRARPWATR